MSHDAHARPPESMRALFKKWQKASLVDIQSSQDIIEFPISPHDAPSSLYTTVGIAKNEQSRVFRKFLAKDTLDTQVEIGPTHRYELKILPGLYIYPYLITHDVQVVLLDKLFHRDLSNPCHKSNLDLHYEVSRSEQENRSEDGLVESFFTIDPGTVLLPKNSAVHRPLTVRQMLDRKLRWMTLGGQYDWTAKAYPAETPPQFPNDIGQLLQGLFPHVDAQAAIVNLYTPGDTLSVHRDVSEDCDRDLVSISIGCDGLFIVGNEDGTQLATLRLKSGDVILMSESSRFAWHAVPKVLSGTCPEWLQSWPAPDAEKSLDPWRDWMANKRINLNIRQMREE